jgi:3-oxoacyl-ACP reductase-like protein
MKLERREVGSSNVIQSLTSQTHTSKKQMLKDMEEQFAEAAVENVAGHPSDG